MKRLFSSTIILLLIILLSISGFCSSEEKNASKLITINLVETSEAFRNPMKGFRPSFFDRYGYFYRDDNYASTYKHYIEYTSLEKSENDSVQRIKDWCNTAWVGIEKKNIKVIPRVVIEYPNGLDGGEYWPDGVPRDSNPGVRWTSESLKNRLVAFVLKLGEAWDNDPRVAAVELGLWGKWGEHHIYPDVTGNNRIPRNFQKALGDAFSKAFKNKKIMVRNPETFVKYNFGYYWDSFALPDDADSGNGEIRKNHWQTQMYSGEVAYNWGNRAKLGKKPNDTLSSDSNTDYVIKWIRKTHTSSLGWISDYTTKGMKGDIIESNAARMQKALGYRFVIDQVTFPGRAIQNGTLVVSVTVSNVGNAPFYYNWPVEASLLNDERIPVWKGRFDTDITKWLPGKSFTISNTFTIPADLPDGTYTLALTVLDPAGEQPGLRFANTNYYKGGRTPVGRIGVNQEPANQDFDNFDSLKSDNSLSYSLNQNK